MSAKAIATDVARQAGVPKRTGKEDHNDPIPWKKQRRRAYLRERKLQRFCIGFAGWKALTAALSFQLMAVAKGSLATRLRGRRSAG